MILLFSVELRSLRIPVSEGYNTPGAIASRFRNAARFRFEAGAGGIFYIRLVDGVSGSDSSSLGISPHFGLSGCWKLLSWDESGVAGVCADRPGAVTLQG